jgi:hypothetical protein
MTIPPYDKNRGRDAVHDSHKEVAANKNRGRQRVHGSDLSLHNISGLDALG